MEFTEKVLELIQTTAQKAQQARIVTLPDHRSYGLDQGGKTEIKAIPPANRNHTIESLNDLIAYAKKTAECDKNPVVWHNQDKVILIIDDDDRRDLVTFHLVISPQLKKLMELEEMKPELDQRELIKLLRLDFNLESATIALYRRLDWSTSTQTTGDMQRGKESLGRKVESQVTGTQDVPENIVIPIPLYLNQGEDQTYSIRCLVEFNALAARIQIVPQPDELSTVLHAHQQFVRKRLIEGLKGEIPIPVYYGSP